MIPLSTFKTCVRHSDVSVSRCHPLPGPSLLIKMFYRRNCTHTRNTAMNPMTHGLRECEYRSIPIVARVFHFLLHLGYAYDDASKRWQLLCHVPHPNQNNVPPYCVCASGFRFCHDQQSNRIVMLNHQIKIVRRKRNATPRFRLFYKLKHCVHFIAVRESLGPTHQLPSSSTSRPWESVREIAHVYGHVHVSCNGSSRGYLF